MHPVEWTKRHLEILISHEKFSARMWIRQFCDRQDLSLEGLSDDGIYWDIGEPLV